MNIFRRGAAKDHGWKLIASKEIETTLNGQGLVVMDVRMIQDRPNHNVHHDYQVQLSLKDLRGILGALSKAVPDYSELIAKELAPASADLMRVLFASTGLTADLYQKIQKLEAKGENNDERIEKLENKIVTLES